MQIGHAGTLDPMATGLLIICTGTGTKAIDGFVAMEKAYSGTLRLGQATPSYDAETDVSTELPWEHITGSMQMTDFLLMHNYCPDEGQVHLLGVGRGTFPDHLACMYTALFKRPPEAKAWQSSVSSPVQIFIQACPVCVLTAAYGLTRAHALCRDAVS